MLIIATEKSGDKEKKDKKDKKEKESDKPSSSRAPPPARGPPARGPAKAPAAAAGNDYLAGIDLPSSEEEEEFEERGRVDEEATRAPIMAGSSRENKKIADKVRDLWGWVAGGRGRGAGGSGRRGWRGLSAGEPSKDVARPRSEASERATHERVALRRAALRQLTCRGACTCHQPLHDSATPTARTVRSYAAFSCSHTT